MHRTQIYLQDDEYKILREHCFRNHISISEGIRVLIQKDLIVKKPSTKALEVLLSEASKYKSKDGRTDVSTRHDDYAWGNP